MWPLVGKALLTIGKAVAIEVGAKHLVNKFSNKQQVTDRVGQKCPECKRGTLIHVDPQEQHRGTIRCVSCNAVMSRYQVTES